MKTLFYILIFFLLFISEVFAQWQHLGLDTNYLTKVTRHPHNSETLFVGSRSDFTSGAVGSLFKSTDSGISWDTLITVITVMDIVVDPINPDTIYIAAGANAGNIPGVLKTTDGGNNWFSSDDGVQLDSETKVQTLRIDPNNQDILFCGTNGFNGGNLYKSTDGGANWEYAGYVNGGSIRQLKFGRNSDEIYAASWWSIAYPVGFFKTTNRGNIWDNFGDGINGQADVYDLKLDSINQCIYISINAWDDTSGVYIMINNQPWELIGLSNQVVNSLEIVNNSIYAATDEGLYYRDLITNADQNEYIIKPSLFNLYSAYPNPFNPITKIRFTIPGVGTTNKTVFTKLTVYDILGNKVTSPINEEKQAGDYEVLFNADKYNLTSGIYFYQLETESFVETKKMMLIK